jgi:hypothetical protein
MHYANASSTRTKSTIPFCRFLTAIISFVDLSDTAVSALIWVIRIERMYDAARGQSPNKTTDKIGSISNLNDAALTAAYTGLYLICVLIFAGVAWMAMRHLKSTSNLDGRFKLYLILLTVTLVLRCLLDLVRALVFKLGAHYQQKKFDETLMTTVVYTIFYGFFSVIVYGCILCISTVPVPQDIDHRNVSVEYVPEEARKWHRDLPSKNVYNAQEHKPTQPEIYMNQQQPQPKQRHYTNYRGYHQVNT